MPLVPKTITSYYEQNEQCDIYIAEYTPKSPGPSGEVGGGLGYDTSLGETLANVFKPVYLDPVSIPSDLQFVKLFLKNTGSTTIYDVRIMFELGGESAPVYGIAVETSKNMDNRDTVNNPASTIPNMSVEPNPDLLVDYGNGRWQYPLGFGGALFINPLRDAAELAPGDTIGIWIRRQLTYSDALTSGTAAELLFAVVYGAGV